MKERVDGLVRAAPGRWAATVLSGRRHSLFAREEFPHGVGSCDVLAAELFAATGDSTSAMIQLVKGSTPTKSIPAALRTTLRPPSQPTRYPARSDEPPHARSSPHL
jgi:hypothetical protein